MAGIDKAAIGFSIAIVAIGVGFAFYMGGVQDISPVTTSPAVSSKVMETETMAAEKAAMAEAEAMAAEKAAMAEAEAMAAEKAAMAEAEAMAAEKAAMAEAGPQTHSVEIPVGTSVPGCEDTNACYLPANITINAGDTVEWPNVDTAAHTVTSGSPAEGPSGVFDSSLLMADATFAFTFEDAGEYDYFCMVHPWMIGSVSVTEGSMMEETMMEETMMEETMMEEPVGPQTHSVEIPVGTSVPGCEDTNACYLPANITINAGDTVEWPNVDTAAHTVTSGSPAEGPSGVFDSSLLMADATFAFTFEDAGEYDYFCMVHPWMIGSVSVN
ncbi:MAG: plastocyanin/azurin family copper-binding protein [Nitrosopumilus sp.]|nr:plastocyanin/azurin family copper-binding protein [Nitrosopumilus sp.]